MRLKYKLFFSYLILIAFLSLALILQITQIRHLDITIRARVEHNVQEVIDLAYQQHLLEKVYDQYLLFNFPGRQKKKYRTALINNVREYSRRWESFKSRQEKKPDLDVMFPLEFFLDKYLDSTMVNNFQIKRYSLQEKCEVVWAGMHTQILNETQHGDNNLQKVKKNINDLRNHLVNLSEIIGEEAGQSGHILEHISDFLRTITIGIIGGTVLMSIAIALFVTRKISRPVEELRYGLEQVAIQNYDVHISHKTNDEIGDLADAFQQMALRLQKNETYKTDILSQFTHEMKSPLGAIKQAVNLLDSEDKPPSEKDRKRLLSIIKGNNDNLFRLISNILRSTTYQESDLQLSLSWENVTTLLSNVLILLSPSIKEKNMKVNIDFASEKIDCEVDADRLKEVFHNLITNAVKFSRDNSQLFVTIQEKYPAVIIKLKDQGIGIPREEIPYIFEKMYRASNSKNISVKGTGLGLFVVSQIIRAHGGKIKVNSKIGEGTEFTITLPRTRQIAIEGEWL